MCGKSYKQERILECHVKTEHSDVKGVDHAIWTRLNVEIGVEYRKIIVEVFF
jgi:hypothetical protein